MFFEDEKENLDSLDNLDDLELDLDDEADDESISWDELLKDDDAQSLSETSKTASQKDVAPLKIRSIKEESKSGKKARKSATGDAGLSGLDDNDLLADVEDAPRKDAFEVFGGSSRKGAALLSAIEDDVLDDDSQSVLSELDSMESVGDSDDEEGVAGSASSKSVLDVPVLAGIILALVLVVGSIMFIFFGPKLQKPQIIQQPPVQQVQETVSQNEEKEDVNIPSDEQEKIPVLDDKNAKKLKPEKKIVLSVESAGRVNPFMPTFDEFNNKFYSGIPAQALMPPDSYGNEPDAQELMKVAVSGILFDNVKPSAIITINDVDYFVQKGDKVDDYTVLDINRQSVVVKKGTNIYKAGVGERFSQNLKIDGSAVYGSGGARYYKSVSPEHTSTSDVEIHTQD